MTKMPALVSSASMMTPSRSFRRSRSLLASSQALACSMIPRTVPKPEPCGSPDFRMTGRMPLRRPSPRLSGGRNRHRVLGALLGAIGRVRSSQVSAALGSQRMLSHPPAANTSRMRCARGPAGATIEDNIPGVGSGIRIGSHPADENGVHPPQERGGAPARHSTAQRRSGCPAFGGPQFAPLHAFPEKEPERRDHFDRRDEEPTRAILRLFYVIDDVSHQPCRRRSHALLPVPMARELASAQLLP
jgi:hypothetical protein